MTKKAKHANPQKNRTPRHRAREFALQGIYQWLLNNKDVNIIEAHIREAHTFNKADAIHFNLLLHGTIHAVKELHASLALLIDRSISELSPIEHAILLIGAFELKNHLEIPYKVIINEAVELTKSFGGTDGHKYINGVLDRLSLTVRTIHLEALYH